MLQELTTGRQPPQNLEAERSVLGAILLDSNVLLRVFEIVHGGDFYRPAHQRVFQAMTELMGRSTAIDMITVKDELARHGQIEEVGGVAYIASLVDGVPDAGNAEYYARIVRRESVRRQLIFSSNKIIEEAFSRSDADSLLDMAEKSIYDIHDSTIRGGFVHIAEIARQNWEQIERMDRADRFLTGLASGFMRLDEMTSGLQDSDLIVVAARPAMGKTSLCLNIAQHAAIREKKTVGFFSLEMSRQQLGLRLICSEARINSHKLRGGFLNEHDWGKLAIAMQSLSEANIYIDDSPAITLMDMRAKARRLALDAKGLDLIVVDYLQLMQGGGRFENRNQEISTISRGLKQLAKELAVPVVALSQLSRQPERRTGDHRPQLADLRESGAIEQDADVVLFIYRDEIYNKDSPFKGLADIIIAKQRNGPIGEFKLVFLTDFTRFENYDEKSSGTPFP